MQQRTYLTAFFTAALAPTLFVLAVNALIDPLWYGAGNRLFPENFPYNERFSKANLFLRDSALYDCLILGSSRSTLLDATRIRDHDCFNFAVSNGAILEYGDLLRFAEANTDLREVIAGIDAFNFTDHGLPNALPGFILDAGRPPPAIESYLSLDVFDFSARALVSRSKRTRFYDSEFRCDTMPGLRPFEPVTNPDPADPHGGLAATPTNTTGPFFPDRANDLAGLRRVAPDDTVWTGYVPPLSSSFVLQIRDKGNLDDYLHSIWIASRYFDRFYDFSVPSEISMDPENTYDGSHFFRSVNDQVAETLSGGDLNGALAVHRLTLPEYVEEFRRRLEAFSRSDSDR